MEKKSEKDKDPVHLFDEAVGRNIRSSRASLQLSKEDLASMIEVPVEHLTNMEAGLSSVQPAFLVRIAQVTEQPVQALLDPVEKESRSFRSTLQRPSDTQRAAMLDAFDRISDRSVKKRMVDLMVQLAFEDD